MDPDPIRSISTHTQVKPELLGKLFARISVPQTSRKNQFPLDPSLNGA